MLARLVKLLALPVRRRGAIYVWPPAYDDDRTAADWKLLYGIYSPSDVARWRRTGEYFGLRVGITARGNWLFFVGGD
jgi:hypothetical protein